MDFANIQAYPPDQHAGIIVLRLKTQDKTTVVTYVRRLVRFSNSEVLVGELWIVEPDRIRDAGQLFVPDPDADYTTFRADDPPLGGVLQISAARKNTGIVPDRDLKEFAEDRLIAGAPYDYVRFGECSGFTTRYRQDGLSWQAWCLRSEHIMMYTT